MLIENIPNEFVSVPTDSLKLTHNGNPDIPTAYFHSSMIVRWLFSRRLRLSTKYICYLKRRGICVDLGCGGGAFLATLSSAFNKVIGIDKDIEPAAKIVKMLSLSNVELIEGDFDDACITLRSVDGVFAISVIEHLNDPHSAICRFSEWMAPDALLVISVPSENLLYRIGRWLFGFKRPYDHHVHKSLVPLLKQQFSEVSCQSWPCHPLAYCHIYVAKK